MRTSLKYLIGVLLIFLCSHPLRCDEKDNLPSLSLRENYNNFNRNINRDNTLAYEYALKYLKDIDTSLHYHQTAEVYDFLSRYEEQEKFIFSTAIKYEKQALRIYEALKDEERVCYCQVVLARQNIQLGNYHTAFSYTVKAYEMAEKLKYRYCMREALLCFEDIYYFFYKDASRVKEFNDIVSGSAQSREEAYQQVRALNKLLTYPSKGISAENIVKKLESICDFYGFNSITPYAYINTSLKYGFENQGRQARYYLYKAKNELVNFKDSGYFYAAEAYYYNNVEKNKEKAIQSITRSIRILNKGEFDIKNYYSYSFLKNLYEAIGEYDKALEASNTFFEIYNRINDSRIIIQLAESQSRLQQEQRDLIYQKDSRIQWIVMASLILLLMLTTLFFILFRNQKKLQLRNAILTKEKIEQDSKSKDDIIQIRRLQQYQANTYIDKLLGELAILKDKAPNKEFQNKIYEIMRQLNSSKDKSDWEQVEKSMEGKNSLFYNNLISQFPDLTPNERKLCTFIHMNMSSKEISNITQQSISSINTARTRLRKKFELTGDEVSLTTFLDQFEDNKTANPR